MTDDAARQLSRLERVRVVLGMVQADATAILISSAMNSVAFALWWVVMK